MNDRRTGAVMPAVLWGRTVALARRFALHQSSFSVVSAILTGTLVITFSVDLIFGHPHMQRGVTTFWLISYSLLTLIPLVLGSRYPRWAGLLAVTYISLWSAYFLFRAHVGHTIANAFLELPLVALYLGWFWRPLIARGMTAGLLALISGVVLIWHHRPGGTINLDLELIYAIIIVSFSLEAGVYVRSRMSWTAEHDPLTGVLNRNGLNRYLPIIRRRARRNGDPLTLTIVDFDDFKEVNDTGGHAAGDEALCTVAHSWVEALGKNDLVVRIGGDEFLLVMHMTTEEAAVRNEEMRMASCYSWTWGFAEIRPEDTLDQVLVRADDDLYRWKRKFSSHEAGLDTSGLD